MGQKCPFPHSCTLTTTYVRFLPYGGYARNVVGKAFPALYLRRNAGPAVRNVRRKRFPHRAPGKTDISGQGRHMQDHHRALPNGD